MSGLFSNALAVAETRETENAQRAAEHAARQEKLRQERREAAERQRINEQHGSFVQGLIAKLEKMMGGEWKPEAIKAAEPFVEMLIKFDGDLPEISEPLARLIRPEFVYLVFQAGNRLPSDLMVGQRQDWCIEGVARLQAARDARKARSFKARPADAEFPSDENVPFHSTESDGYRVGGASLPEAITPPKKGRGASKRARQLVDA